MSQTISPSSDMDRYLDMQRRIIAQNSLERKESIKRWRENNEKDYWSEVNDSGDRTPFDYQGYDDETNEEEA